MSALIIALIISAVICTAMWRRPDARAAVSGAWQAGKSQAVREFRQGYQFAQQKLRAGNPSWKNPRRWASWTLAGAYGTAVTVAAANRIRRRAWEGGRTRYMEWKAAQPVDAEVVAEVVEDTPKTAPAPTAAATPDPSESPAVPPSETTDKPAEPTAEKPAEQAKDTEPTGSAATETPGTGQVPQPEGADVQTEATGLTSYAQAHAQFAAELREQMSGSESLAASMSGILAEHSDLIGDTAILQDLLNQAASVANRIETRALEVANN